MSTTDSTASSGSDGLTYFWVAVRLAGGTLGVLTLLSIATVGLGVEYKAFFQEFLNRLKDWIELAPLLDPIEKYVVYPTLEWFRTFGWTIPDLADHWRSVFTLTWLLMLSMARNQRFGSRLAHIAWAFVCSITVAVATGTMPLDSLGVFTVPLAGFLVYVVGPGGLVLLGWWRALIILAVAAGMVFGSFAVGAPAREDFFGGLVVPSPGILMLCYLIGMWGLVALAFGLAGGGTWRERWNSRNTAIGLDIVGVMGAALFIGWLMLN